MKLGSLIFGPGGFAGGSGSGGGSKGGKWWDSLISGIGSAIVGGVGSGISARLSGNIAGRRGGVYGTPAGYLQEREILASRQALSQGQQFSVDQARWLDQMAASREQAMQRREHEFTKERMILGASLQSALMAQNGDQSNGERPGLGEALITPLRDTGLLWLNWAQDRGISYWTPFGR